MPRFPRLAAVVALVFIASFLSRSAIASSGRVARPGAQVRSELGFAGPVLASPDERAALEVLERRNEWVRVKLADGREGWIHELFVADDVAGDVEPPVPMQPVPDPCSAELNEMGRRLLADHGEMVQLRLEAEYGRVKVAEMNRAVEVLHDQLEVMRSERDIAAASLEQLKSQEQAAIDVGVKSGLDIMRAEERAKLAEKAAADRAELEARHAQVMAELEARHQSIVESFIAMVSRKHDDALARETAVIQDECDRRLIENNRKNAKELRIARKESGYEADLEKEIRVRLDMEILEARTKWEAKQRGEMYDVERARREEGERVRRECEGARLAAVNLAAEAGQADLRAALSRERQEADLRCQVALSIVLEQAAAGGDMAKVKSLAERTVTRRSGDAVEEPVSPPESVPVPQPVPFPPPPDSGGTRP